MRKDPAENKGRVSVGGKRVRVSVLQSFEDHEPGESLEMAEGRELKKMITLGWVRLEDEHDAGS